MLPHSHTIFRPQYLLFVALLLGPLSLSAADFEGRIEVEITRGTDTRSLVYTVGESFLRVEIGGDGSAEPINLIERKNGETTLLYPSNHSFVRLPRPSEDGRRPPRPKPSDLMAPVPASGADPVEPGPPSSGPSLPPGAPRLRKPSRVAVPPRPPMPPGIGPLNGSMPGLPPVPVAPNMTEPVEIKATGWKKKLLGYQCEQFKIKQPGQVIEIWATDKLLPYLPYLDNQPPQFGPRRFEDEWPRLIAAKKLFPLVVSLRQDPSPNLPNGPERFRLEVKSITAQPVEKGDVFQVPIDFVEMEATHF